MSDADVAGPDRRRQAVFGRIGLSRDVIQIIVAKGIAQTTGPKISSRTTRISGVVFVNTVGSTNQPSVPCRLPPVTTSAPCWRPLSR